MGQQARALEQRLRVLMAFEVVAARDWENWLASLDDYMAWAGGDPKSDDYPDEAASNVRFEQAARANRLIYRKLWPLR